MTSADRSHGQNGDEIGDAPSVGDEWRGGEDNHCYDADDGEGQRVLEGFEDFGDFDEEV